MLFSELARSDERRHHTRPAPYSTSRSGALRSPAATRRSRWLYAAAALRGGLEPDLASDSGWWGAPAWEYAYYALAIYLRVAAERTGRGVAELASELRSQASR